MNDEKPTPFMNFALAQANLQHALDDAGAKALAAGHDSLKLHDIEKFLPNRLRFRGVFRTTSIQDFVKNILDRSASDVKGFIQTKASLSCEAIFNLGDEKSAGHADDKALLTLEPTPEFSAAIALLPHKLNQKQLSVFIEDWRDYLTAHVADPQDPDVEPSQIALGKAIVAVRNVTISHHTDIESSTSDVGSTKSALEMVEAKSKKHSLPSFLILKTSAYPDLPAREIKLRISVNSNDNTPSFSLHFVGQQAFMEKVGQDFKDRLVQDLSGAGTFLLGSFTP
jgi:uncharacterized protein YfdQ (DUF2303 family)